MAGGGWVESEEGRGKVLWFHSSFITKTVLRCFAESDMRDWFSYVIVHQTRWPTFSLQHQCPWRSHHSFICILLCWYLFNPVACIERKHFYNSIVAALFLFHELSFSFHFINDPLDAFLTKRFWMFQSFDLSSEKRSKKWPHLCWIHTLCNQKWWTERP